MHLKNGKKVIVENTGGKIFFLLSKAKAKPKSFGVKLNHYDGWGRKCKSGKITVKQCCKYKCWQTLQTTPVLQYKTHFSVTAYFIFILKNVPGLHLRLGLS